MVTKVSLFS
uniref:Uncharacterized protein n=1 Tax=Rhizophora mucronata TaxID=61149 RepID=A0A2P2PY70_RHIMU